MEQHLVFREAARSVVAEQDPPLHRFRWKADATADAAVAAVVVVVVDDVDVGGVVRFAAFRPLR